MGLFKQKISDSERKANIRHTFIVNSSRKEKENYLRQMDLFKEEEIKNMSNEQLNEFVEAGFETKGY